MILLFICMILGIVIGIAIDEDYSILIGAWIGAFVGFIAMTIIAESSLFLHDVSEKYELAPVNENQKPVYYLQEIEKGYTYNIIREEGEHKEYIMYNDCYMNYEEDKGYVVIHKLKYNKIIHVLMLGAYRTDEGVILSYEFHIPKDSILED